MGSNILSYPDDTGLPAANLLETKVLINSTISDAKQGARFMLADITDYFLATPMTMAEYMKVEYNYIPHGIIEQYNLQDKVTTDGYVYIHIEKGMYGLKQATILAYENFKKSLKPHGYAPVIGTVGLWKHKSRSTNFFLSVDDFGIKYYSKDDT